MTPEFTIALFKKRVLGQLQREEFYEGMMIVPVHICEVKEAEQACHQLQDEFSRRNVTPVIMPYDDGKRPLIVNCRLIGNEELLNAIGNILLMFGFDVQWNKHDYPIQGDVLLKRRYLKLVAKPEDVMRCLNGSMSLGIAFAMACTEIAKQTGQDLDDVRAKFLDSSTEVYDNGSFKNMEEFMKQNFDIDI